MLRLNHLMQRSLNAFHHTCYLRRNLLLKNRRANRQLKSKVVKRNARIASKASRGSMGSTWSLEDAQVESKIEVTESIVSGPVYISSDADDIQSSVSLEDDVSEEKRMVAASKR
jgi:hypothetical protein